MRIPPYGFTEPVTALSTDERVTLGVPVGLLQTLSAELEIGRHATLFSHQRTAPEDHILGANYVPTWEPKIAGWNPVIFSTAKNPRRFHECLPSRTNTIITRPEPERLVGRGFT